MDFNLSRKRGPDLVIISNEQSMAEYDADFQGKDSEVTHKPAIMSWGHLSSSWKCPCKEQQRTPTSNQHILARWGSNPPWRETDDAVLTHQRQDCSLLTRLHIHTAQLNSWIPDPQKPWEAAFTFKLLSLGVIYYTVLGNIHNYTPLTKQRYGRHLFLWTHDGLVLIQILSCLLPVTQNIFMCEVAGWGGGWGGPISPLVRATLTWLSVFVNRPSPSQYYNCYLISGKQQQ